jgi:hypothetical protein
MYGLSDDLIEVARELATLRAQRFEFIQYVQKLPRYEEKYSYRFGIGGYRRIVQHDDGIYVKLEEVLNILEPKDEL